MDYIGVISGMWFRVELLKEGLLELFFHSENQGQLQLLVDFVDFLLQTFECGLARQNPHKHTNKNYFQ